MPNTYTFTKRLAEQVINDYSESLPCVIFRPSISTYIIHAFIYLHYWNLSNNKDITNSHYIYARVTIHTSFSSIELMRAFIYLVISSSSEPMEGWIDNFNGPIGMLIGGGTGLIRVIRADKKIIADYVPVDAAVKGILIATCKHGIKTYVQHFRNIISLLTVWFFSNY